MSLREMAFGTSSSGPVGSPRSAWVEFAERWVPWEPVILFAVTEAAVGGRPTVLRGLFAGAAFLLVLAARLVTAAERRASAVSAAALSAALTLVWSFCIPIQNAAGTQFFKANSALVPLFALMAGIALSYVAARLDASIHGDESVLIDVEHEHSLFDVDHGHSIVLGPDDSN